MRLRAFVPPALLWAGYGIAWAAGAGRAADVLVGGQTDPVAGACGLAFLCLRLVAITVAPVLAGGALLGYAFARRPRSKVAADDP